MPRAPDPQVRLRWRQLIDAFDPRRFTVAEFCRKHRISQASFYQWRRRLATNTTPGHDQRREAKPLQRRAAFVPVQLVDDSQDSTAQTVQVHLPNGVRVDVPTGQRDLLWELIENVSPAKEL